MKKIGIIGGIGPESTIEYYRLIIARYREKTGDNNYPEIILNSINMTRMLNHIMTGQLDKLVGYMVDELENTARAGAEFAIIASNTPHIVFDEINKRTPLPLISIVEATCKQAEAMSLTKTGLFGTNFTMQGGFYKEMFRQKGLIVFVPEEKDRNYIHEKYMTELIYGNILEKTKHTFLKIAESLKEQHDIQGLILGGTEIPLIIKSEDIRGIKVLDTTMIHVEGCVEYLLRTAYTTGA